MTRKQPDLNLEDAKAQAKSIFLKICGHNKIGAKIDSSFQDTAIFIPLINAGFINFYPTPCMYGYDHTLEIIKSLE